MSWVNKSANLTEEMDTEVIKNCIFLLITSDWSSLSVVIGTTIMCCVLLTSLLGNILVIIVIMKCNNIWGLVTNILIISLACSDIAVSLTVMPCSIDAIITGKWRCGCFWRQFNGFGNFCFCIASIMNLMMLSIDRYVAICHPYKYQARFNLTIAVSMCAFAWIYSSLWALQPAIGVSSYECFIPYLGECRKEDWSTYGLNFAFIISVVSGTYGLALLVMCFVYLKIYLTVRAKNKINILHNQKIHTRRIIFKVRLKSVMTLLLVIGSYLVFWSPFCVLLFIEIANGRKMENSSNIITMFIGFANSASNPVIYSIKYKRFRIALRRVLSFHSVRNLETTSRNDFEMGMKSVADIAWGEKDQKT